MKSGDRRRLLVSSAAAALSATAAALGAATAAAPLRAALGGGLGDSPARSGLSRWPRELWITRPEAQETVRAVYWADGALQPEGCRAIDRIYRDLRAGVERPISTGLLNLNYVMQCAVAQCWSARPMVLLSGFRTPQTNRQVGGVEPSVHFTGKADDYIYAGLSFQDNLRLAWLFRVGGLGVYPDRGSLHKDVGRARIWVQHGRAASNGPDPGLRLGAGR
jgi:uncharacterized protein YcbK (DUF882 family)